MGCEYYSLNRIQCCRFRHMGIHLSTDFLAYVPWNVKSFTAVLHTVWTRIFRMWALSKIAPSFTSVDIIFIFKPLRVMKYQTKCYQKKFSIESKAFHFFSNPNLPIQISEIQPKKRGIFSLIVFRLTLIF